jgi:hypothetical protein
MGCTCVIAKPFASVAGTEEVQIPTTEAFDVLQRDRAASLPGGKTSSSTFGNNLRGLLRKSATSGAMCSKTLVASESKVVDVSVANSSKTSRTEFVSASISGHRSSNEVEEVKPEPDVTTRTASVPQRLQAQIMGYEILTEAKYRRIAEWVQSVQACVFDESSTSCSSVDEKCSREENADIPSLGVPVPLTAHMLRSLAGSFREDSARSSHAGRLSRVTGIPSHDDVLGSGSPRGASPGPRRFKPSTSSGSVPFAAKAKRSESQQDLPGHKLKSGGWMSGNSNG